MILTKDKGNRMWGGGFGNGSGGSGGSGGGSADHATEADHATNADNATLANEAKKLTSDSTDWLKIARKDIEQTIAEVWTFAKGIASTLKSYFNGGIEVTGGTKTDTLTTTGNATVGGTLGVTGNTTVGGTLGVTGNTTVGGTLGVTGKLNGHDADFEDVTMDNLGTALDRVAKIWATAIDAININAENTTTENLTVTKEAHLFRLVVDELLSNKGAIIITSANCVAEAVAQDSSVAGYYDVYFATVDGNGNSVSNSWRVGDLALCLTFKGEGVGTFSNVRNRYYWRKVLQVESNVTYNDETYHHIRLSNVRGEAQGSTVPAAGDNIVQLGYVGNDAAYRQSAIILSAYPTMDAGVTPPSLAFYKGINDFNLTNHRYTFIDGINNDFVGNFSVIVNGEKTAITTLFATAEGLQAEVTNRQNADAQVLLTAEQLISKLSKETVTVSTNLSNPANWELGIFDSSKAVGSTFAQTKVSSGTYYYCSFRYKSLVALDRDSSSLRAIYNSLDITSAYPDDSRRSTIRPRFLYFDSNSKYIGKSHDGSATGYEGSEAMSYAIPAMEGAAYVAIYFTLTPTSVDLSVEPDYEDYVAAMLPKVMKHQQNSSTFQQLFDLIRMQVEECGISISEKKIVSTADQFEWRDLAGNLLLGMDNNAAVFSGTVKAKNFYHNVCVFVEGGTYSNGLTNTGNADLIYAVPYPYNNPWYNSGSSTIADRTITLPSAKEYEGKTVELAILAPGDTTNMRNIYVEALGYTTGVNGKFLDNIYYDNGNIRTVGNTYSQMNFPPTVGNVKFYAVKYVTGYGVGNEYWGWLYLPSPSGGSVSPGGGGGTVTSVGLLAPEGFTVTGSPVTANGTIELDFGGSISAHKVLAAPSSSAGSPRWRSLVSSDIPSLPYLADDVKYISGIKINGSTYYATNPDDTVDLGTISAVWNGGTVTNDITLNNVNLLVTQRGNNSIGSNANPFYHLYTNHLHGGTSNNMWFLNDTSSLGFKFGYGTDFQNKTIWTTIDSNGVSSSSDARLKDKVEDIQLTAEEIAEAPSMRFTWNDNRGDGTYVGTTAQYWRELIPELVIEDEGGTLSLNYSNAAMMAIISLAKEVVELKKEIEELKNNNIRT